MEERTIVIIEGKKEDRRGYTWNKFIKGQGQEKKGGVWVVKGKNMIGENEMYRVRACLIYSVSPRD